jgi:hypothetical protein
VYIPHAPRHTVRPDDEEKAPVEDEEVVSVDWVVQTWLRFGSHQFFFAENRKFGRRQQDSFQKESPPNFVDENVI